ncbi:MAG: SRPBCC family protein [Phenylobacterium sp.]|uniref:SRPBCC family protein n=1 Tax=Phenylobacterium sp. TaxID=1871053 RepID=UPI0027352A2E|nr:SRPBCC family protein [Phenylobacterium sp.]MDP3747470.1 SRPBCC family protein [Phenylobacterium sp.]
MEIHDTPISTAQMLVRRPVADVFGAFIDPAVTTRFWFSRSSGRLEVGKRVRWDWEMYGASTNVDVKAIEANRRIVIEWDGYNSRNTVEWTFAPRGGNETFVTGSERGFSGDGDQVVKQALDSTGGFNLLLAGLKVFLEHGVEPSLVVDHNPDAIVEATHP